MESELNDLFDNLNVPLLERRRIELSLCLLYKILTLIGGEATEKSPQCTARTPQPTTSSSITMTTNYIIITMNID